MGRSNFLPCAFLSRHLQILGGKKSCAAGLGRPVYEIPSCALELWVLLKEADLNAWVSVCLWRRQESFERLYLLLPAPASGCHGFRGEGAQLCPAQFPLFPLPDENNTGAFRESSVQRDVLDWYGHDLSFSGLPRKGYFRSEPATSQHSSVHQTKDTSGLEDGRK